MCRLILLAFETAFGALLRQCCIGKITASFQDKRQVRQ
jgi:hypothetical protein